MVLPGVPGHFGIPTFNGAATMLMMTGWFYQTIATTSGNPTAASPNGRVVWMHPNSPADRASGGFCATTGFWCAGRGMVTVDGQRHIREFAPQRGTHVQLKK